MKKSLFLLLFMFVSFCAWSQDKIYKIDGTTIACKVTEIGSTEIKYKKWDNLDGPVYSVPKSEVRKIDYQNGTSEIITQDQYAVTPSNALRSRKRAITTRPFGPLYGFFSIGYQQALKPTQAITSEVGFIGLSGGNINQQKANGFYMKAGMRFKRVPEVVTSDMQWSYALGGFYVEPQLMFSNFSRDLVFQSQNSSGQIIDRGTFNSVAGLINIGRQMVFGDIVTLDLAVGVGYAYSTDNVPPTPYGFDISELPRLYYSHTAFGNGFPLAYKFTFAMGILIP